MLRSLVGSEMCIRDSFRVKNKVSDMTDELAKFNSKIFGTQQISQIKLKKSTLTPSGPIYEDLAVVEARK